MLPFPIEVKPVAFAEDDDAVQSKVTLLIFEVGVNAALPEEQMFCVSEILVIVGVGSMVTTKFTEDPEHNEFAGPVGDIT